MEDNSPLLPKQIIICRHVNKPRDKSCKGASKAGLARAIYLAGFFTTPNKAFNRVDQIYCFNKPGNK